jgi:crotonobetainyl-CoA:carnitine CoA-transferase CaiB-like acyl-CoA transferase
MDRDALLAGWAARASGALEGVAERAARALAWLGAAPSWTRGRGEEVLEVRGGRLAARVSVTGWDGERSLRERCGAAALARAAGDPRAAGPGGMVATQYVATLAAAAALRLARRGGQERRLAAACAARQLVEGVPLRAGPARLLRCSDGWVVVRWRRPEEVRLLAAVLDSNGLDLRGFSVETVWEAARACRLLLAPVLPGEPVALQTRQLAEDDPPDRPRHGGCHGPLRVVDWSPLWAGPWMTGRLAREGHLVTRVEPPARRDGLLRSAHGRACWRRWNGAKELALLDACTPEGRRALRELIAGSDVLVTGVTPRVLPQLGFDAEWFALAAPGILHVELIGYDEPASDLPGLGEQAAAVAGLLWRSEQSRPFPPLPWADPLLAAKCLLAVRAWEAAGRWPGVKLRLSLEGAARDALSPPEAVER